jgi:hypothetical protein
MNINIEKLNEYLKTEEILEFDSDEECMEYFNTYDYQELKSVEEMKSFQGKYGFNIGKKRYHINTEDALDVLEDSYFSDEELKIMSDGILALIHNVNEAMQLTRDVKVQDALHDSHIRYIELNFKICNLQ